MATARIARFGRALPAPATPAPTRNPYLDKAAPDLAAALHGPIGRTLLGGDAASVVEILGTSIRSGARMHSTAWLVLTARDESPCAIIVSTSPSRPSVPWSPALQRYEEIQSIELASSQLVEPGRFCFIEARLDDRAPFRPFKITAPPCWILESIWDDTIDAAIYRDVEAAPAGRPGDILPDRAWRPLPSFSLQNNASSGAPTHRRISCARLVLQRAYVARTTAAFKGRLEVAISRPTICAFEAGDIHTALALVPEHADMLTRGRLT